MAISARGIVYLEVVLALIGMTFIPATWAQGNPNYKPKRFNKAIELLEAGQHIYGVTAQGGGYDAGLKLAQTHADYIGYELEHGAFDIPALRQFMLGLAKGGPTKSGHRTPAVIVTLPVLGYDEISIRANYWVIHQVLASGVHGILLCHARDPKAIELFVAATRYPFERPGIRPNSLEEGMRGAGSQSFAAQIWGMSGEEYTEAADPWPLNPKGELLLGLKIEDKHGVANAEKLAAVPGIAFAEWGVTDQIMSLIGLSGSSSARRAVAESRRGKSGPLPPVLAAARARIFAALKANNVAFLESGDANTIEDRIKEGIRMGSGNEEVATRGRKFSKREMPY